MKEASDIWNPQLVSRQKFALSLPLHSHERAKVNLPCFLCCFHLQMAMTTLEQPTSKWSSQLCLDSPYLELVWGAHTLCRRSSWIIPAPGTKKRALHKENIPSQGSRGISKYNRANLQTILTWKSIMQYNQDVSKLSIGLLPRLVVRTHSRMPLIDFSGQEEMEAGWQGSLCQTYKASDD